MLGQSVDQPPLPPPEQRAELAQRLLQHMPEAMRARQRWLLWREEVVPGRNGIQKVPYYVSGRKRMGSLGSEEDRSRLATLDAAVERFVKSGRFSGVGFAFLKADGLVGIDLDDLVDADTGEIREHHAAIIKACSSYTERSPSGKGLHIICAGLTDSFKHDSVGVEVYSGDRYFTCTGLRYEDTPADVRPLEPYALEYLRAVVQRAKDQARQATEPAPAVASAGAAAAAPGRGAGGGARSPGRSPAGGDDFRRVNDAALQGLHRWVPKLFPAAVRKDYGYRISSKALGRDFEEDLQISEQGVMDFGEERGMSPIDVVLRWCPGMATPKDAMLWLASALGLEVRPPAPRARGDARPRGPAAEEPPEYLEDVPPPEEADGPPGGDDGPPAGGKGGKGGGGRKRRQNLNKAVLERLQEHFALVYGTDDVWDGEQRSLMKVKNLRLLFGAPYVNSWLASPDRRVLKPTHIRFEPGVEFTDGSVNLFGGLPTEPVECEERDVKPMLDLLHHLCSKSARTPAEVEAVKLQVLRWCALIIQRPGAKMRFALVFHGPQGTGKNMFSDALRKILGQYGKMVGQTELEDRFNGYMSGKLLLIGNEVVTRQELFHNKNKLKWVITEDEIPIRGMHQEVRWESNHANIIFLSNELMPVALEWDDRRHLVIYTPAADDQDLYLRVVDFLERDGLGKWMHYLQHVDLDDFNEYTKPLMTEAKEALIELGLKPAERFVKEWLDGLLPLPLRVCSAEQLFKVYTRWCVMNGERDFKGQAMFTRTVERYVRERLPTDPATRKRAPPALTYKPIALKDVEEGTRKTVRCWIPYACEPPNGLTEGEWAWAAVQAFESVVQSYGRTHQEGDQ